MGGRLVEFSGREYMVRGRGYIKKLADIENIVVGTSKSGGTPILVKNLGTVTLGPDIRRGVADLDGEGEVVGGIVIMRYGENALKVIQRVRAKLEEMKPPSPGVEIVTTYDRGPDRAFDRDAERHAYRRTHHCQPGDPDLSLAYSIGPHSDHHHSDHDHYRLHSDARMGLTANIMSLGGIAIAIGAMVDAAIVVVEQTHKKLEHWDTGGRPGDTKMSSSARSRRWEGRASSPC